MIFYLERLFNNPYQMYFLLCDYGPVKILTVLFGYIDVGDNLLLVTLGDRFKIMVQE